MNWILSVVLVTASVTAAAAAQSAKAMGEPSRPGAMSMKPGAMSMTYTGCVESVNHGGAFLLTRIDDRQSTHHDVSMKHHGGMAPHGDMATKSNEVKTMDHEDTAMADEKMGAMPTKALALTGTANLSKHVGQKVSVTGLVSEGSMATMRDDVSTLTIKTLKVIAKSCS
jgi:hypothetical protein